MVATPTTRAELIVVMTLGDCDAGCLCAADGRMRNPCVDAGARVLAAIEAAGCRVVPVVATTEMRWAMDDWGVDGCDDPQALYDETLAASPFAPPAA